MAGEDSILLMVGYGGEARALPGVLLRIRKKPAGGIEVLTQSWLAPLTLPPESYDGAQEVR